MRIDQIRRKLQELDDESFQEFCETLEVDPRAGVSRAVRSERKRRAAQDAEAARTSSMYQMERELLESVGGSVLVGLDEAGRGPIAGPLAVSAVVLPEEPQIVGLNDSKKLSPTRRENLASQIRDVASAWCVVFQPQDVIDSLGISEALKRAFSVAVQNIEASGTDVDVILLDGNPLGLDDREVSLVKADAKCASVAAASILAKTERDAYMCKMDSTFPQYGFAQHKGYETQMHAEAIQEWGLCDLHRKSFCGKYLQESAFGLFDQLS